MFALVIPVRDEERSLGSVITEFRSALEDLDLDARVLVVDDHSTDDSARVASLAGARVLPLRGESGLAAGFRLGCATAVEQGADAVITVDGDGQHSARDLPAMVRAFLDGNDLVVGNRLWRKPQGSSDIRYSTNVLLSNIVSATASVRVDDAQCGFRVFSGAVARDCAITGRFTYTQEQIVRAGRSGYRVGQARIESLPRMFGSSRIAGNPFEYMWRAMQDLDRLCRELGVDVEAAPAH